jgi:hypothetical protein
MLPQPWAGSQGHSRTSLVWSPRTDLARLGEIEQGSGQAWKKKKSQPATPLSLAKKSHSLLTQGPWSGPSLFYNVPQPSSTLSRSKAQVLSLEFLNLSTVDILSQIISCVRGSSVHSTNCSNILFSALHTSSNPPQLWQPKVSTIVLWGPKFYSSSESLS